MIQCVPEEVMTEGIIDNIKTAFMGTERDRVLKHYNNGNIKEVSKESALKYLKDNMGIDLRIH